MLGTSRTKTFRICQRYISQRNFQPRPSKPNLPPPYGPKKNYSYKDIEPSKNWENVAVNVGANYEKFNALYDHYQNQEFSMVHDTHSDYERNFAGLYGEYWPAHYGGGYVKFLKRRSTETGAYNHRYFWVNWYRRKLDERGIHWEFPRGQDYHSIIKWFLCVYLLIFVMGQYNNVRKHFQTFKPPPPPDTYPPRFNLPFYVYIIHEIPVPFFE